MTPIGNTINVHRSSLMDLALEVSCSTDFLVSQALLGLLLAYKLNFMQFIMVFVWQWIKDSIMLLNPIPQLRFVWWLMILLLLTIMLLSSRRFDNSTTLIDHLFIIILLEKTPSNLTYILQRYNLISPYIYIYLSSLVQSYFNIGVGESEGALERNNGTMLQNHKRETPHLYPKP
jgi:hypothetical protein